MVAGVEGTLALHPFPLMGPQLPWSPNTEFHLHPLQARLRLAAVDRIQEPGRNRLAEELLLPAVVHIRADPLGHPVVRIRADPLGHPVVRIRADLLGHLVVLPLRAGHLVVDRIQAVDRIQLVPLAQAERWDRGVPWFGRFDFGLPQQSGEVPRDRQKPQAAKPWF